MDGIRYDDILSRLKSSISASKSEIFQSFIKDHILENMHKVTVELYPSNTLVDENAQVCLLYYVSFPAHLLKLLRM